MTGRAFPHFAARIAVGFTAALVASTVASPIAAEEPKLQLHYGIRSLPMTAFLTMHSGFKNAQFDPSLTLLGAGFDFVNYGVGRYGRLALLNVSVFALGVSFSQLTGNKDGTSWARYGVVRVGPHLVHMVPIGPLGMKLGFQSGIAMIVGPKGKDVFDSPTAAFALELLSMSITWVHDEPAREEVFENYMEMPQLGSP